MQTKLLRVLAEQRIKTLGSNSYVPVNVRVIAATRRELLEEINRGAFRDDLYFRIAQERLTVPPLRERERSDDLGPIIARLMEVAEGRGQRGGLQARHCASPQSRSSGCTATTGRATCASFATL